MTAYIAYYRVSTDRQGSSGLGLDAQRQAVRGYLQGRGELISEYIEVESGRHHTNRPQLLAALDACKTHKAVLLIARLDRLARNVAFIAQLMESNTEFVAVDMPQANRLTMHIIAAVAEHEREMISQRTKAALQAAKERGTVLGNPRLAEARQKALQARRRRDTPPIEVRSLISSWHVQGRSLREIARELNRLNIHTPKGAQWYASSVRNLLRAEGKRQEHAQDVG